MSGVALLIVLLVSEAAALPQRQAPDVEVEQVAKEHGSAPPSAADVSVPNVARTGNGNPASVTQLPPTLDAPPESSKGEAALARGDEQKNLTAEVARAAELIRQRGQQPTPEALAREIGPDILAAYLNQHPAGLDIYAAPENEKSEPPAGPYSVDGTMIILPDSAPE